MNGFLELTQTFLEQSLIFADTASQAAGEVTHNADLVGPDAHVGEAHKTALNPYIMLAIAAILVILNGFFVAAEFALVKVRFSQVEKMVKEKKMFAKTARWLALRLDHSLSACQLGITMASLALGYVGEPAFAFLIRPVFEAMGVQSENTLHIIAFIVSFSVITSLHLVIGEQAPKIFAIRRPQEMVRWCAPALISSSV